MIRPCFGIDRAIAHRNRQDQYVDPLVAKRTNDLQEYHSSDDLDEMQTVEKISTKY